MIFNKSLSYTFLVKISGKIVSFLTVIFLTRYLTPSEYGEYSLFISYTTILALPLLAGIPQLLIKKTSEVSNRLMMSSYEGFKVAIFILLLVWCVFIYAVVKNFSLFSRNSDLLILVIGIRTLMIWTVSIINGHNKVTMSQFLIDLFQPTILLLTFSGIVFLNGVLTLKVSLYSLTASFLLALILSLYCNSRIDKKYKNVRPSYLISSWVREYIPFSMVMIVSTLNTEMITVLLGNMVSLADVAYFKLSLQFMLLAQIGVQTVNSFVAPKITKSYRNGQIDEINQVLSQSVKASVIVSVPLMFFVCVGVYFLSGVIFGEEYKIIKVLVPILFLGQISNVITGPATTVLNMTGHQKTTLGCVFFGLVLNLVTFLCLVESYNVIGAAISISTTSLGLNVISCYYCYKRTKIKTFFRL